tara:strand:+ start:9862 stop:11649 length:1788 start_codon:yes stop_codon:yes gene_type:complete
MSRPSRVVLPVLDLEQNDKPLIKRVVKGCKELSVQKIVADSAGQTSCSFSWQPPSQNTIMDRRIEIEVPVRIEKTNATAVAGFNDDGNAATAGAVVDNTRNIKFHRNNSVIATAVVGGGATQPTNKQVNSGVQAKISNNFAPRQFPIASCIETIDMTINGTHFTASLNQYLHALMKYTTPDYREKVFGNNGYHHPDVGDYISDIGNVDNPLNLMGEGGRRGETPRASLFYNKFAYAANAGGTARAFLEGTITEPLFLSPLMFEFGHGMTNVNDISITINWTTDLNRMLSIIETDNALLQIAPRVAAGNNLKNATLATTINGNPNLVVRYYTAQDDIKIPNEIVLPYKQPKLVLQPAVNIATNHTFIGNNIRLNQVPEAVYIYAKQRRTDTNSTTSDSFVDIQGVRISWKNRTGLLSGFRQSELLQTAQANGADTSATEANNGGYVLKLVFGKDIPLDDNESAGTRGDYNWQLECDVYNHQSTRWFEFYQVFVYNGHAVISPNECRVMTGVLDLKDNVEAEDMGDQYHGASLVGGSYSAGSMVAGSEVGGSLLGSKAVHLGAKALKLAPVAMGMAKDLKPCVDGAMSAYSKYKTRA